MIGNRLKQLREEKNLPKATLAKELNMTPQSYGLYENEKRSPDYQTLKKLANYFTVSMAYLLGETDQKNFSSNTAPLNDFVETANPNVINIEDLSAIEKVFLQAYRQLDRDMRQKFIEHFIEALDTHRAELATQKNIEAELERYRLELEAEHLGKTSSASGGRKRGLG